MMRRLLALALLSSATVADAERFRHTWTDPNWVPCEGIGASGSGRVQLIVDYVNAGTDDCRPSAGAPPCPPGTSSISWPRRIRSIAVGTNYLHTHQPSARLDYTDPRGRRQTLHLERPWYTSMSGDGWVTLVGRRLPNRPQNWPIHAQQSFETNSGPMTLQVSVHFPQLGGGSCFASFRQVVRLP